MSIRGEMFEPLFKQHTFTLTLGVKRYGSKKRFFDKVGTDGLSEDGDILAITRNYDCNEFLGDDDRRIFEKMKEENPEDIV